MLFVFSADVLPSHSLLNLSQEVEKAYQPWHVRKESYVLLISPLIPTQPLPIHDSTYNGALRKLAALRCGKTKHAAYSC